jgi:UDP-N-acetylmuramate--alanine ligase
MNLENVKFAYFLGIGGIGMSAIARYFNAMGIQVSGYDKTPSDLTEQLQAEGIQVTFTDAVEEIPAVLLNNPANSLFVLTPAIPADHKQWNFLKDQEISIFKRSEVLGMISRDAFCIAVAGTHGKTTTSTLIAHILFESNINFVAFLGGISANYQTNYIHKTNGKDLFPNKKVVVLEADEFDRSFHRLNPDIAIITAIDPDHLDIYGTNEAFFEAFSVFAEKIKPGGNLILNYKTNVEMPANIHTYRYGLTTNAAADFRSKFTGIADGHFTFNYTSSMEVDGTRLDREVSNIYSGLPGFHNIENATAAIAVCLDLLNLDRYDVKQAVKHYRGAKRRFEFVVKKSNYAVVDDYAHHPEELNAIISSVRELYPDKKLTGIFQPHLFTRTRDFADGFATSLAKLDELILMDIYPARELPIPGITSQWLLNKVQLPNKSLLQEADILQKIKTQKPELLLILGAGDIDRTVPKIKEVYDNF